MSDVGRPPIASPAVLRRLLRNVAPLLVLVGVTVAIGAASPGFLSPRVLLTIADESSALLVLALGQTLVVLTGRIDLSMATLASLATVVLALLLPSIGWVAVPVVIGLSAGAGLLQGWIHVRTQLPSFVVTLGGLGIWAGLALTISNAQTIGIAGGIEYVAWAFGNVAGIPRSFVVALAIAGVLAAVLRYTRFGRWRAAIGYSELAAVLAGVPTHRVVLGVFAMSGACSGVVAILLVARSFSAGPTLADSLLLPALSAVVVGGTAITGGFGGIGRTVVGALIITVLRVGLGIMGINPAAVLMIYGAILVVAVALTIDRSKVRLVR